MTTACRIDRRVTPAATDLEYPVIGMTPNNLPHGNRRTPTDRRSGFFFILLVIATTGSLLLQTTEGKAQGGVDSAIAQTVRSTRGYMIRIPATAELDSSRSGWNPTRKFERRVYVIPGTGEIVLRVEIGKDSIPATAVREGSYTFIDSDSLASSGTIHTRTWYLEHRRVSITLIPWALGMKRWTDHRLTIYNTFRWSEGADSDVEDLSSPPPPPYRPEAKRGLGGN